MNIHDVNRFIEAYNAQAQACAKLAAVWEEIGWQMIEDHAGARGIRPTPPVQVSSQDPSGNPPQQAGQQNGVAAETHTVHEPAPSQSVQETTSVSLVELRMLLAELSQAGFTQQVRALITGLGFDKLSEVPENQYAALFAQAKQLQKELVDDEPPF